MAASALVGLALACMVAPVLAVDDVFVYSSSGRIRGLNITRQTDMLLTTSPVATAANALAVNSIAGYVYYGDDTSVYRWDPASGAGAVAHSLMMNFATGPVTAPITELNSTAGSFLDGVYYVGSEGATGAIEDLYALTMSLDGTQVVAADALDLLGACNCSGDQIGGFGDIAAVEEGGVPVIYGSSSALTAGVPGSVAGRWRFVPSTDSFTFLTTAANGQLAASLTGRLYSNVGQQVREVDRTTGATGATTLITTTEAIFDFTSGFSLDFGDAPDSYGAAFHRLSIGSPVHIGALAPDNEAGTLNSLAGFVNGLGDDDSGDDDEDAVSSTPTISVASGSYSLSVACSVGSRVAGWIDFDIDGRFDAIERNDNHPAGCSGGQVTLEWDNLPGINGGSSWLRLRASSNVSAISQPTGIASDGEVEDHAVLIDAPELGSCPAGSMSTVYTPNDLPVAIPATSTGNVSSIINVPGTDAVVDVNLVGVQGQHTWINDLQFRLIHAGTTRVLYGYACASQDDFSFGFDDESNGSPVCPPTAGESLPPTQSLDAFDGIPANGAWELQINDRFNQDGGSLDAWSLEICTAAPIATNPEVRLGKAASVSGREVTFTFAIENVGDVDLEDVQIDDDLDVVFGTGNWSIVSVPDVTAGPAGLVGEAGYTGSSGAISLLAGVRTLGVGEQATVKLVVQVDTLVSNGEYANSATATAQESGTANMIDDVSSDGLDLSVDGAVPTPVLVDASATLSGQVFVDSSAAASVAHDGVRQPGETAVGGRTVEVFDASGGLIGSTRTDGDGYWQLTVPEAAAGSAVSVRVQPSGDSVFVSEAPLFTTGSVADGRIDLVPGVGATVDGVDVGVVPAPRLDADRNESAQAGSTVRFAHVYIAPSHGTLTLSLDDPDARLLRDTDCDGVVDAGEPVVTGPASVVIEEQVCLLLEAFVPAGTAGGAVLSWELVADLALSDPAATGHGVTALRRNRDVVTVTVAGSGRLVLDKRVRNVTRNEAEGVANDALPGETLEYLIRYRNAGSGALDDLAIDDIAPPYSQVDGATVGCGSTPASMVCTPAIAGDALQWRYSGALPAGAEGDVSYRVTVD